jgi:homogentisate 1,2-dioxygenase
MALILSQRQDRLAGSDVCTAPGLLPGHASSHMKDALHTTTEMSLPNSWVSSTVATAVDPTNSNPVVFRTNAAVPHGVAYPEFKAATESELQAIRISEGAIAFMFESSRPFTIMDYAMKSKKLHEHDPEMWDDLVDNFSKHLKEVEAIQNGTASNGVSNGVH